MEPAHKTLTLTVPNGVLKKHHQQLPQQQQQQQVRVVVSVYRECLKNHAASLGGHALDGCGEFMASPSSNPSDPTSLTCAACGCHRNFHRRLPLQIHNPTPLSSEKQPHDEEEEDDDDDEEQDQDEDHLHNNIDEEANEGETGENSSAPHMLLALSAGVSTHPQPQPQGDHIHMRIIEELQQQKQQIQQQKQQQQNGNGSNSMMSRKRFRSKFSPEQKERMQDLSERLGWKMQKRDEGLIEERCREIGIDKGVFKVWMHNNKHNFLHSINSSSSRHPNNNNFTTTAVPTDGGVTPAAAAPMSNGNGCNIAGMKINGSDSAVS